MTRGEELAISLGLSIIVCKMIVPNMSIPSSAGAANDALNRANQALAAANAALAAANSAKVSSTITTLSSQGLASAGSCTLTGANVGDRVASVISTGVTGAGPTFLVSADFEHVITVQNQIQQTGGNHANNDLIVSLQGP